MVTETRFLRKTGFLFRAETPALVLTCLGGMPTAAFGRTAKGE